MDMDQYILKALEGELLYESLPVLNQGAFVPYTSRAITEKGLDQRPKSMNMYRRMVQFLRKSWAPETARIETREDVSERSFRHRLNERMRRDRERQSYMALHSMLPNGAKCDKNWIVKMTAMNIQQLQRYKEELRKRNMEVESILVENEKERVNWRKIRLRVANPTSGVDSMLEVLRCLHYWGLKARNVQSNFSAQEFSAELEIETKIGAVEIEEAMQETLHEAERIRRSSLPGR